MKQKFRSIIALAMVATVFVACKDDEEDDNKLNSELQTANEIFVNQTVIPTYKGLADECAKMQDAIDAFAADKSDAKLKTVCDLWKTSRQYWEWSEAFLFGAASGYGIDPHIDTWPFDVTVFDNLMSKYHPATSEDDAAVIDQNVATGQNLTGFHALEYVIFRNGQPRAAADLTADEVYYCQAVAADLFLSACRLEAAWAGTENVTAAKAKVLEDNEMEPEDFFGEEFRTAGNAGSRWKTVELAAIQIIEGCQDIIDEVAHSKIGAPHTGEDANYIESPNAQNSIQDFYDNVMSCKHALYGGLSVSGAVPAEKSLMAYLQSVAASEANAAMSALETALDKVNKMKRPFVLNYTDASADEAIKALEDLDEALDALKGKIE